MHLLRHADARVCGTAKDSQEMWPGNSGVRMEQILIPSTTQNLHL